MGEADCTKKKEAGTPVPSPEETAVVVEAVLFASSHPLTPAKMAEALGVDAATVKRCVEELNAMYERTNRSFRIEKIAEGYLMLTHERFAPWIKKLHAKVQRSRMSPAMLETLAVIAYKQPVTRAEIEAIRGVQCGEMIRGLMERRLVRIAGKKDVPGKPFLYATTKRFLEYFGLASINDLKKLQEEE